MHTLKSWGDYTDRLLVNYWATKNRFMAFACSLPLLQSLCLILYALCSVWCLQERTRGRGGQVGQLGWAYDFEGPTLPDRESKGKGHPLSIKIKAGKIQMNHK